MREWVRGRKKERFQSKKVEKDTPHIIKPHQVRAWSDRSFVFFSRGAAWGAEESSSRNRAERSAVSFSLSVSPRRRIESGRIARLEFQKIDTVIFDVANGNENGFLCFFFYDDDERQ